MADLTRDGIKWDPYASWHPERATPLPDGAPDTAIVPLVENLRDRGIVTVQSCSGHDNWTPPKDGRLWVAASTVADTSVRRIVDRTEAFSHVQRVIHPQQLWQFYWHARNLDLALAALATLERPQPGRKPPSGPSAITPPKPIQVHIDSAPQQPIVPVAVPFCPRCGGQGAMRA